MKLSVTVVQEFIINTDTEHYTKVITGDVTKEDVIDYIKNEIRTNQMYWNALRLGETDIEVTET